MTLIEFYNKVNGDYEDVIFRFRDETRIMRFAKIFLRDEIFNQLQNAIESKDWSAAFRAAHTIKGMALNMSFTRLFESSAALTEHLRGGAELTNRGIYDKVCADYMEVISNLERVDCPADK